MALCNYGSYQKVTLITPQADRDNRIHEIIVVQLFGTP